MRAPVSRGQRLGLPPWVEEIEEVDVKYRAERLTDALLSRLAHHVHINDMNGDNDWLRQSSRASS